MKQHAFSRYEFTHNESKVHHRHLPTFSRWGGSFVWTFMHLFMPWMIHYLTDKYEGRLHHVIVDTIYAAVTMTLLFTNLGIGVWYFLYFTPADIDARVQTRSHIESGEVTDIVVTYANPYRDIEDVQMSVELPSGFIAASGDQHQRVDVAIGNVEKGDVRTLPITGVVFGNVGQRYSVRVVTSYSYLGNRHEEVVYHHFLVHGSTLDVSVQLAPTAVYGRETSGTVRYVNRSSVGRKDVDMTFILPKHFVVTRVAGEGVDYNYIQGEQRIRIPKIAKESKGSFTIRGYFSLAVAEENQLSGDQQTEIGVSVKAAIDSPLVQSTEQYTQPPVSGQTHVVNPRATLFVTSPRAIYYRDSIVYTVTVRNTGDTPVTQIALRGRSIGAAARSNAARIVVRRNGETVAQTTQSLEATADLPVIDVLQKGESATYSITVPTVSIDAQNVTASLTVSGTVFAPEIATTIPLAGASATTKFHSQIELDARALYFTKEGEQIGYGPYPPRPWEQTSFITLMTIHNRNNAISNVQVTAVLSNQVEWTDLYSVSAGTSMSFNTKNRTLSWTIGSLQPQSQHYGSQFELIFTPNSLQQGLKPNMIDSMTITATDAFTGERLRVNHGRLTIPVGIAK